jgi:hypothetical protein
MQWQVLNVAFVRLENRDLIRYYLNLDICVKITLIT